MPELISSSIQALSTRSTKEVTSKNYINSELTLRAMQVIRPTDL
jgi:hypothetical protein